MAERAKTTAELLNEEFVRVLNSHGFSYQYAAIRAGKEVFDRRNSGWRFLEEEFPVHVQGRDGHIDFVLKHKEKDVFIVVECKRANPAYSNWCFIHSPAQRVISTSYPFIAESVVDHKPQAVIRYRDQPSYFLGFELKAEKKGDERPKVHPGKGIDEAALQVSRGVSGLVNYLLESPFDEDVNGQSLYAVVIPVIFTTANLYVSDLDLFQTDIATGDISISNSALTRVAMLTYQYRQSPTLRPDKWRPMPDKKRNMRGFLLNSFARTIYIVNSEAIATLLEGIADVFD